MTATPIRPEDKERIRDYLKRQGWPESEAREVFDAIDDEYAIDPEGGAFLLEVHLAQARKWAH